MDDLIYEISRHDLLSFHMCFCGFPLAYILHSVSFFGIVVELQPGTLPGDVLPVFWTDLFLKTILFGQAKKFYEEF